MKHVTPLVVLIAFLILALSPATGFAATRTWTGATSTDWATASNWGGTLPSGADVINIPGSLTNYPVISTTVSGLTGAITVNSAGSGATLTVTTGGAFTTTGLITVNATGIFRILNGTASINGITSSGSIDVQGGTIASQGSITVSAGTLTQSGGLVHMAINTATNPTDVLLITGGTVTQSGGTFYTKDYASAAGTFNQTGATAVLRVFHDWKPSGTHTFNSTAGTVRFSGSGGGGPTFVLSTVQFSNILVDAAIDPVFDNVAASNIKIAGDFTNNNTALNEGTNATFTFNGGAAQTVTSASTGTNATFGNLTINNSGAAVSLASNVLISGALTVKAASTLALSTFTLGKPTSVVLESGTTGAAITGSGTFTLGGNVTVNYSGSGSGGAVISAPVALGATRTFTVADDGTTALDLSVGGVVSGAFGVTKAGAGSMELSGLNTYTGTTLVSAGVLRATNNTVAASTNGPFGNNASALQLGGGTIQSNVATFSRPLTVTVTNSGLDAYGSARTVSSAVNLATAGAFNLNVGGTTAASAEGQPLTLSGIISNSAGTLSLTKAGTSTVELSGLNTYTGTTTAAAGFLRATNNSVAASTSGPFGSNASGLNLGGGTIQSNVVTFTRPLTVTVTNSGLDAYGAARTVGSAVNLATAGTFNLNIGGTTAPSAEGQPLTLSGIIGNSAGSLGVTKGGTSTATLSAANTFTGGVTLNAGTLNVNNANALGTVAGTFSINGGTIDNTSVGALTTLNYPQAWNADFTFTGTQSLNMGTGAVAMSASRQITVGANTFAVGGVLSGAGFGLTKAGAGTLTLSGTNTFTGGTTLAAGGLNINNAQALGTVAGTFTIGGGTIDNTTGGAITTLNYPQAWNSDVSFTGTRNLNLGTGAVTISGNRQVTVGANTLTVGGTISAGSSDLTKAGPGTLSFGSQAVTLHGLTVSAGTLTSTSGSLSLAGDFSNSGVFTNNGGTVMFNGAGAQSLGGSTATTFGALTDANTGAALSVNTNANANGALTLNTGTVLAPAAAVVIGGAGTLTGSGTAQVTRTALSADFNSQYTIANKTLSGLTVEYAGTGAPQVVNALAYGGLKINNASGVTLSGSPSVAGSLTFAAGTLTTGADTLTVGTAGSVAGAGPASYVFGNLQKAFDIGAQSFTYDIGDASNYTPVGLSFASVTSPGTAAAKSTGAEHPGVSAAGLDAAKSVNRYWTLTPGGGLAFSTYDGTFTFVPGDVDAGASTASFVVRRFNGTAWSTTVAGTRTATSTQATGVAAMGDFAVGNQLLDHFVLSLTTPQSNGVSFTGTNTLTAEDLLGAPVADFDASADNVTVAADAPLTGAVSGLSGGNKLSGAGDFSSGVANLTSHGLTYTGNVASGTFTASSAGGKTGTSGSVTVGAGALDHFSIAPVATPQVATKAFDIAVTAEDVSNNPVAGFSGTVNLTTNAGTIAPTVSGAFSGGARTESVTLTLADTGRTITVDDGSGHAGTSNSFTVDREPTSGTLTSAPNPSVFGQPVTLRDSVAGSVPDGGKVYFIVDGATVDSANLDGSGVASVTSSGLPVGARAVSAFYGGTGSFDTSRSNTVTQDVNKSNTALTLTSGLNPSVFEQGVTFTARAAALAPGAGSPTGSVTFYDGAVSLGTFALAGDSAEVNTANLSAGGHTIKAVYAGDGNFNADSASVAQTVNQAGPTVTLTSGANPSTFEQSVTFKATVTNSSHTPTGSVTFYDGAVSLGTFALSGDSAELSTANLSAGSHTMKAVYGGDADFKADSATVVQTVNQAAPTVALTSSANPSTFEQSVMFKARVTNSSHTPSGSVTFYDGAASLGTVPLAGDSAEVSTADLSAGSHTIKAVYGGDADFKADSASLVQMVNQGAPAVVLTSSANPSTFEQSVTFKAKVHNSSHTPTGSVTFYDGGTSLGAFALAGDSAEVSTADLSAGSHSIKAVYGGDGSFNPDSTTIVQTVDKAVPTMTLASGANPSTFGESVSFTAKVHNSSHTPTGSVTFYDGGTPLGTVALAGDSAGFSTSGLGGGSHTVKAVYGGDASFLADSAELVQAVNRKATVSTLETAPNPTLFAQPVLFRDSVSGPPDGGKVFFKVDNVVVDSAAVNGSGIASVSTAGLSIGSHSVSAFFAGTPDFDTSTSNSVTHVVTADTLTLTAVAGSHGAIAPSGTVKVLRGADQVFTITADTGYFIADVHVDSVSVGAVAKYTFTSVSANHLIEATFGLRTFIVKGIADAHGSISPSGPVAVNYGADQSFTITPDTGYFIADVHVDSVSVGAVAKYTFTNVTAPHVIEATFAIQTFTVKASAEAHGSISPSGVVPVNYGADQSFTITPDSGYFITDVHVDSVSVGAVAKYTFAHVTGNHVIVASFEFQSFTIFASAGPHGTIAPSGAVPAGFGGTQLFTLTPDSGYFVADVHVDSVSVGAVTKYTFTNIKSDHTIQAFFDTHPLPQLKTVSPATAYRAQTADLVFTGLNFAGGVSTLNAGAGITVNSFTVHSSDTILANVTVSAGASLGARSFTVTNSPPGGGTSGPVTFTVLNHVPSAFSLAEPVNGDTIKLKAPAVPIEFSWHPSADLDAGDTLTYLLHLAGTPLGDSVTVKGDTSVSLANLMGDLLPHTTYVWTMSVTDGFDTVAAADTFSYTTSDSVSAVADKGKRIPTEYALHQNYPNPFNPSTVIEFDLPHQSAVTLVVYNLIGQEIARLVDGRTMSAGYQSVRFDASSLPSGAYLYRISADGANGKSFVRVRKMMIMR